MAYIGSTPTSQNFTSGTDYFSGTGSQTAYTLTRTVNSVNDIEVVINNVVQQPSTAYTLSGTTITFTSAPSSGTNNIYVRYLATNMQSFTVSANSITRSQLDSDLQAEIQGRNRIINGSMVIDQRNAGASVTQSTSLDYVVDRWAIYGTQASKVTVQQNAGSVTPPAGFTNYLGFTSSSSYSVSSSDLFEFVQFIEGYNVSDLGFGTADAKTITVSFWVRSSLTGTFGGGLTNNDNSRNYPFTYTITAANTWQKVSLTITGDTTGTWLKTNGRGFVVVFDLGSGSDWKTTSGAWNGTSTKFMATGATSVVGTSGATFYITGVQLEEGTTATSFEREAYSVTLQKCQRYFQKAPITYGAAINTTTLGTCYDYPVVMRATPTLALLTTTPYAEIPLTTGYTASGATIAGYSYAGGTGLTVTGFTGFTSGRAPILLDNNQVSVSAEL